MCVLLGILWYLIGFISGIFGNYYIDYRIRIKDIILCLFAGIAGPVILLGVLMIMANDSKIGEKVLIRRKK